MEVNAGPGLLLVSELGFALGNLALPNFKRVLLAY